MKDYDDNLTTEIKKHVNEYIQKDNSSFNDYNGRKYIEEMIYIRCNYLGIFVAKLQQEPLLKDIVCNKEIFEGCMKSQYLYMNSSRINEKELKDYFKGIEGIEKDNRIYKRIRLLEFIENWTKISRFGIDKINLNKDQIKKFIEDLGKKNELLESVYPEHCNKTKSIERAQNRIKKINSRDRVQKFLADLYNRFDNIIMYDGKRSKNGGKRILYYSSFEINKKTLGYHKIFNEYVNNRKGIV